MIAQDSIDLSGLDIISLISQGGVLMLLVVFIWRLPAILRAFREVMESRDKAHSAEVAARDALLIRIIEKQHHCPPQKKKDEP